MRPAPSDIADAIHAAISYMPRRAVGELLTRGEEQPRPSQSLNGSVMFVDVAGFTAFVVSLCHSGQKGIDALQAVLSEYFSVLIDGIYKYGGDVYVFSGDAMLVGFVQDDDETAAACSTRTLACATHLRSSLSGYESQWILGDSYRIQLKIGLAYGDYHYILMGEGTQRYTCSLIGLPVQNAMAAEHIAVGGDIIVDKGIWEVLATPREGAAMEEFVKVEAAPEYTLRRDYRHDLPGERLTRQLLAQCERFVEPSLFKKITTSHSGYAGEYREVTCVFARFTGNLFRHGTLDTLERLNQIYRFVYELSGVFAATLNRIEMGDKGYVFLFVLGAPNAMENKRSVAGRLALRLSQHSFPFVSAVQVGIATGYAYCGEIGGRLRRDYTIVGNVVNLAARLMTYPRGGGIFLDSATRERLDHSLLTKPISNISFKGISGPITIYSLHSEVDDTGESLFRYTDRMVGRDKELGRLIRSSQLAASGHGRVCGIVGEPGIGKSRITAALLEHCRTHQPITVIGFCHAYRQFTPYSCWKDPLRRMVGVSGNEPKEVLAANINEKVALLDGVSAEWSPVIAQIMGIAMDEEALTRDLDPDQKNRRVFQIILQLIRHQAKASLLALCFEDVHWVDDVSLRLIEHVAWGTGDAAVLMVLTSRGPQPYEGLAGLGHFEEVEISHLTGDHARELLREKLALERDDTDLEDRILEKAQGNPFYLESIARNLVEQGILALTGTGFMRVTSDPRDIKIPFTLQDLILTRIDGLNEDEKTVIRMGAVVGRVFEREVVDKLKPGTLRVEALDSALSNLEALGFTGISSQEPPSYYFKHAVIRDVAYDTLALNTRESLHRAIGSHIEQTAARSEQADILAHHFLAGNQIDKGLTYTVTAARNASKSFSNKDAIYHYGRALEILSRDEFESRSDERFRLKEDLGHVYRQAGKYDDARKLFTECLGQHTQPVNRARIHIGIGHVCQEEGYVPRAINELETALRLLGRGVPQSKTSLTLSTLWHAGMRTCKQSLPYRRKQPSPDSKQTLEMQHAVMSLLGKIYFFSDISKAAWTVLAQLDVAEKLNTKAGLSSAYGYYAVAMMGLGFIDSAAKHSEQAVQLAKQTENPMLIAYAYMRAATLGLYTNDLADSIHLYQQATDIFQEIGEMWEQLTAIGAIATAYYFASDFAGSVRMFSDLEKLATELNSSMHIGWAKCWGPFHRYLIGEIDADTAKQGIREAIPHAIECNDAGTQILVGAQLSAIAVRENDPNNAAWLAEETYDSLRKNRDTLRARPPMIALVYTAEAALFGLRNHVDSVPEKRLRRIASETSRRAIKLGKNFPFLYGPGLRVHAAYTSYRSGAKAAQAQFSRAVSALESGPDQWQTGLAYVDMVEAFPDRSGELLSKARERYEAKNLQVELRRLAERSH